jgi:hypothetical protein
MPLVALLCLLADSAAPFLDEVGVAVATLLTMGGLVLQLYRPRHQMHVEERVKDSRMTEDEARRQIKFYEICAPIVTVLGVVLLSLAIYDMGS